MDMTGRGVVLDSENTAAVSIHHELVSIKGETMSSSSSKYYDVRLIGIIQGHWK